MSTPTPSDNLTQPGPVSGGFPPDPLLASGSFISTAPDGTLNSSADVSSQGGSGAIGSRESIPIAMSNGTDLVSPSLDNSVHQSESKSRKRTAPLDNWLPPGWTVVDKVRTSGATAGTVDKYYHEPITGRKFRSRTEVLYYLEHGTSKKGSKKAEITDFSPDGKGSSKKASKKAKVKPLPPLKFDFENPPEKVSWSMANAGEEAWIPFVGDDKVHDSVRRDWSNAFTIITTKNPSQL